MSCSASGTRTRPVCTVSFGPGHPGRGPARYEGPDSETGHRGPRALKSDGVDTRARAVRPAHCEVRRRRPLRPPATPAAGRSNRRHGSERAGPGRGRSGSPQVPPPPAPRRGSTRPADARLRVRPTRAYAGARCGVAPAHPEDPSRAASSCVYPSRPRNRDWFKYDPAADRVRPGGCRSPSAAPQCRRGAARPAAAATGPRAAVEWPGRRARGRSAWARGCGRRRRRRRRRPGCGRPRRGGGRRRQRAPRPAACGQVFRGERLRRIGFEPATARLPVRELRPGPLSRWLRQAEESAHMERQGMRG